MITTTTTKQLAKVKRTFIDANDRKSYCFWVNTSKNLNYWGSSDKILSLVIYIKDVPYLIIY